MVLKGYKSITVPERLHQLLKQKAEKQGTSIPKLIYQAINKSSNHNITGDTQMKTHEISLNKGVSGAKSLTAEPEVGGSNPPRARQKL